jgi:diguanylate cyclase (GGDEF)-like protein
MGRRIPAVVLAVLTVLSLAYPLAPGSVQNLWFSAMGFAAMIFAFVGLWRRRPAPRAAWVLVFVGYAMWVVADLETILEQEWLRLEYYPVPSDALYLSAYVVMGTGFLLMVRNLQGSGDVATLLDAAIITTGIGVIMGVFVVEPIIQDSGLTVFGQLVSSAYPLADVLLLGILVRIGASPGGRTRATNLLVTALFLTLLADIMWEVGFMTTGAYDTEYSDALYLLSYVAVAAAAWAVAPSAGGVRTQRVGPGATMRFRLALLCAGLGMPAGTLVVAGVFQRDSTLVMAGLGSLVLVALVLARMFGLLKVVQELAERLADLARSDSLTGAPNRRTWDYEFSRACAVAREGPGSLSVAMLDLDHFKLFNDTHGHQAGDAVLRDAVHAWIVALGNDAFLARYGGEEFAILFPDTMPDEAAAIVERLRPLTPRRQTFSAGVAAWHSSDEPGAALAAADAAMYDAKRLGRDRVVVSRAEPESTLPVPAIAFQPIVDLVTGTVVAVEALSRFDGLDPRRVFDEARADRRDSQLQAQAVRAALHTCPVGQVLALNVSLEALSTPALLAALPDDLHGIVLEITEETECTDENDPSHVIATLRARGCRFAIDDWGKGYSNMDRLLRLRPDIVKLDIELVRNVAARQHRAVIRAIVTWAEEVDALVCGEGIETLEQRDALVALGVQLGQGYLLGHPQVPGPLTDPLTDLGVDSGHDLVQVADHGVVRLGHHRGVGICVDGHDRLRRLASGPVLDGAADAAGDVDVGRDPASGLADLLVVRPPAEARHDPRYPEGAT